MVRLLISYGVSALITLLFFTLMYTAVFSTYSGGMMKSLAFDSEVMSELYWPVILKLLLALAILYVLVVFPISWVAANKLATKKILSLGLFALTGFILTGIGLMAVEPIIATDYFEYGERQELNKVLEAIGYGYTNAMIYACAILVALSAWAVTQLQFKRKEN